MVNFIVSLEFFFASLNCAYQGQVDCIFIFKLINQIIKEK